MSRGKCPCPRDCPGRSATCHAHCRRYLAAWEEARRENAARLRGIALVEAEQDREKRIDRLYRRSRKMHSRSM